jgi:hypothetical protein
MPALGAMTGTVVEVEKYQYTQDASEVEDEVRGEMKGESVRDLSSKVAQAKGSCRRRRCGGEVDLDK